MNRRIFHGAAAGAIYTAAAAAAGVVQFRIIVRALPADMAGLWLLFVTIGGYVAFFDLGISPTVGREISFSLGSRTLTEEERIHRVGELLATLWNGFRVLAVCIGLLCLGAGEAFIRSYGRYNGNQMVEVAWAVFSFGVALNLLGGTALAGLYGLGEVAAEKTIRCAVVIVGLALTFVVLKLHTGLIGLAVAWTLQWAIAGLLGWWRLRRRFPEVFRTSHRPNWALARSMVSPAMKLASIQLGAILILQSGNPLIAVLLGASAIPPYDAISKIAITLMTLALLIVNSSSPFFSMTFAAGERSKMTLLLVRNLRLGVGLMVVLTAFVAVNGDRIIAVWLKPKMFAGFPVLWTMLFMVLLEVHHVIFATAVMAAGQIVFVRAALASGILNITLAVALAGKYGLLGLALATAIGQLLTNNWYAPYFAARFFRIPASLLMREVWAPIGLLVLAEVGIDVLIRQTPWLGSPAIVSLAASAAASIASGAAMWWLLALRGAERVEIREYLNASWTKVKVEHA